MNAHLVSFAKVLFAASFLLGCRALPVQACEFPSDPSLGDRHICMTYLGEADASGHTPVTAVAQVWEWKEENPMMGPEWQLVPDGTQVTFSASGSGISEGNVWSDVQTDELTFVEETVVGEASRSYHCVDEIDVTITVTTSGAVAQQKVVEFRG